MNKSEQVELVRCARHVAEYRRLESEGLIRVTDDGIDFVQPDHPRVISWRAESAPQGDMIDRAYLLYEAGQMVAEAKARRPNAVEAARRFALSVLDMPMPEVRKHLAFFTT